MQKERYISKEWVTFMRMRKGLPRRYGFDDLETKYDDECRYYLQVAMVPREQRLKVYFNKEDVLHNYNCIEYMEVMRAAELLKISPRHLERQVSLLRRTDLTIPF